MAKALTDTFSKTVVFEYPNGKSIVHYPDLTDEERERRHKRMEKACIKLVMEAERIHREKEAKETAV